MPDKGRVPCKCSCLILENRARAAKAVWESSVFFLVLTPLWWSSRKMKIFMFSWRFSVSQSKDLFLCSKLFKNVEALYTRIITLKVLKFLCLFFFFFPLLFIVQASYDRYLWIPLLKTSWEIWGPKYPANQILLPVLPVIKYTRMMHSWNAVFMFKAVFLYLLLHFKPAFFSTLFSYAIVCSKFLNTVASDSYRQRCRHLI